MQQFNQRPTCCKNGRIFDEWKKNSLLVRRPKRRRIKCPFFNLKFILLSSYSINKIYISGFISDFKQTNMSLIYSVIALPYLKTHPRLQSLCPALPLYRVCFLRRSPKARKRCFLKQTTTRYRRCRLLFFPPDLS